MTRRAIQNTNHRGDPRWQFFPARKRRLILESWLPKRNAENEKRILLKFKMPITGQEFQGFPEFLLDGYHAVEKEHAGGSFSSDTILEQMAIEYFDTGESKGTVQRASGVTLQGITLSREKEGESYVTILRFHYNVPWFRGIWKFLETYWGMTLWADFVPSPDYKPDQGGDVQMRIPDDVLQTPERAAAVTSDEG